MIDVVIDERIFASVLKGLYESSKGIHPEFIPSVVYDNIVDALKPHLENWDYDKMSLEEWVINYLTIAPSEVVDIDVEDKMVYVETDMVGAKIIAYGYLPL